jgi:hypothetical protein
MAVRNIALPSGWRGRSRLGEAPVNCDSIRAESFRDQSQFLCDLLTKDPYHASMFFVNTRHRYRLDLHLPGLRGQQWSTPWNGHGDRDNE